MSPVEAGVASAVDRLALLAPRLDSLIAAFRRATTLPALDRPLSGTITDHEEQR